MEIVYYGLAGIFTEMLAEVSIRSDWVAGPKWKTALQVLGH